jgi:methylthioribose-1-phosphate isomerase
MTNHQIYNLSKSVWIHNGSIQYLDETRLPCDIRIGTIQSVSDAQKAIGDLKIRALGQVFLILYLIIDKINQSPDISKEDLRFNIESYKKCLTDVRPTFPFEDIVKPYISFLDNQPDSSQIALDLKKKILDDLKTLEVKRMDRVRWVARLLNDQDCILTHCNTSGDIVLLAQACKEVGKTISFYVTETRPHLQGARLTAWELVNAGFNVTLISDSAVARTISEGRVHVAITGADRCAQNGDIINKVGTFQIAVICKALGIPLYVMAQAPSKVTSGQEITIEYRNGEELFQFPKPIHVSKGIKGVFPCFDITPASYIDRIINFQGIHHPHELKLNLDKSKSWI